MKEIEGGITAANGFEAAGVEAGVKYKNRKDMALVFSTSPCKVAGTFTTNVVKAAPVKWDMQLVKEAPFVQAVVVNSGIANACTGKQGLDACEAEAECAGKLLGIPIQEVFSSVLLENCHRLPEGHLYIVDGFPFLVFIGIKSLTNL